MSSATITTPIYPITSNSYWVLYTVKGAKGDSGVTTATVYIYRRLAGTNPPALPTARTTYTFSSAVLTGLDNQWGTTIPTGIDPLYVSTATATGSGLTDFIDSGEWAAPALLAKNGIDGLPGVGTNGVNTATIPLYQTTSTSTPPTKPSVELTYTFSNGSLVVTSSGLPPDPWKRSLPTTGAYRWITTATALGTSSTDTILASEWSTVSLLAQDGVSAAYVIVTGEQAFKFLSGQSTPTVANITLTAALFGGLSTYSWEYWNGGWVPLSGTNTNQTYSLSYTNAAISNVNSLRIRCASGGTFDEITVLKLYDGSNGANGTNGVNGSPGANGSNGSNGANGINAINGYLTNESSTLPADSNGTVSSYAAAAGNFKVFSGTTDVTSLCSFSKSGATSGLTCTITAAGAYSISGTMNADTAVFTLNAVYSGATISKVLNISRAKAGAQGPQGPQGSQGLTGATGGQGPTGPAGAGTNYTGASDPTTSNPAAAINGDSYFQTTTNLMWVKIAGTWQKVVPQITSGNRSTFIADAAIGQAQIGSAAIGTLAIQGEAVTVENVIAVNAVSVTKTTSASTWTNFLSYSTPGNAIGYPTIIDLQFPDSGTTSNMVGGSSVSYALRVIDSSSGLVLASFSNTYVNRTRFLAKISSIPAQITIQRQILYTPGTGYLVYDVAYKSALLLARTVKK
jgi:hypothetical protein